MRILRSIHTELSRRRSIGFADKGLRAGVECTLDGHKGTVHSLDELEGG
jgi:hypothetical protein